MAEAVRLEGVARFFTSGGRRFAALRDIDLAIAEGELVAVLGRSGSGKTTLLGLVGGLDQPDEGRVCAAGEEVSSLSAAGLERFRRERAGWMFQAAGLHPLLTAEENVALVLRIQGRPDAEARGLALAALADVGLEERTAHRAHELSGGELLADEPTGQLDTATARQVTALIRETAGGGLTAIVATHDESLAEVADRVVRLRDGRLLRSAG